MLLKEYYQSMHGKLNEVDDDQMIKYKTKDGESKEMEADSAKRMSKDHPAKIAYDKLAGDEDDGGDSKPGVNIFDEPDDDTDDEDTMDNLKWGDAESTPETDIQAKHWDDESNWSDDNKELRRSIDNSGASYYLKDPTRLQNFKNNPKSAAKLMKDKNWPPEVVQHMKDIGALPSDDEPKVPAPDSRSDVGKPRVSANPYDDNFGQEVDGPSSDPEEAAYNMEDWMPEDALQDWQELMDSDPDIEDIEDFIINNETGLDQHYDGDIEDLALHIKREFTESKKPSVKKLALEKVSFRNIQEQWIKNNIS